ncbi:MAG: hypothetical protein HY564_02295 [Candidatus Jacksonbacteria bacterium]|nr:hypothetical protein [Candidatus Jacksonbacteria bacterium]
MSDTHSFSEEEQQTMRETALAAIGAAPSKKPVLKKTARSVPLFPAPIPKIGPSRMDRRSPRIGRKDNYQSKKGGFLRKKIFASLDGRVVIPKKEASLVRLSKLLCILSIVAGCIVIILAVYILQNQGV